MEGHYLESSSLGKAINYYLERRKGLHRFLTDKYAPIDNNMAERLNEEIKEKLAKELGQVKERSNSS